MLKDSLLGSIFSLPAINLSEMSPMMVNLCTVGDYFFEPRKEIRWAFRGMGSFRE